MEEKTILIVAKDNALRKAMRTCMEDRGYVFIKADNGATAWRLFKEEEPDLVITYLYILKMDGMELLERIYVESPDIPVIVVSDRGTGENNVHALQKGAFAYIAEPVQNMTLLQHTVKKALDYSYLIKQNLTYIERLEQIVTEKTAALKEETRKLRKEIKERKAAERLIEHAKREWESTIDALPDMVALLDKDYRIIRMNKAMARLRDLLPHAVVGERCCEYMHGTYEPPDFCPHSLLLKDGKPHTVEIYDKTLGGYNEISAVPYRDSNGTLMGSVHVVRNINKRKAAEKAKEKMQVQRLQAQKLESVGQLAAGIAHEINTPTQYVGTNIDFMDESFQDMSMLINQFMKLIDAGSGNSITPELMEEISNAVEETDWEYLQEELPRAIEQSRDGVHRITSIVRAMKEFSHPGGREKEPVDLNSIIETTVTVARNEWKYVAEMKLELDGSLPQAPCMSDEMGQVILNIIVNAAHAIGEKLGDNPEGEKGIITITTSHDDEWAVINLSDTGKGIPEKAWEKVFEPFFTTKEVGRGTGQGLAIAKNVVVDKHKGVIDFDTEPGEGTTFIIKLPLG